MSDLNERNLVPVNINTASVEELRDGVVGIGQALAERIVVFRTEHGEFAKLGDLVQVSGIGERLLDRIGDQLTLEPGATESIDMPPARRITEPLSADMLPEDEPALASDATAREKQPDALETNSDQPPMRLPEPEVTPLLSSAPTVVSPAPDPQAGDPWLAPKAGEAANEDDLEVTWEEPVASLADLPIDEDEEEPVVLITPPPPGQPAPPASNADQIDDEDEEPEPWEEVAPAAEQEATTVEPAPQPAARTEAAAPPSPAGPAATPRQRSFWSGVGLALIGGLAGVILTLAVLALWSGTLSFTSRREFDALSRNVSTMQANYEMSWERLDDLSGRMLDLEGDLRSTTVQVNALQGELDAVEIAAAEMAVTIERAEKGISKLAEDLRSLDDVVSSRFSDVEARLDVAEVDIAAASEAITVLGADVAALRDQTEAISARIERFDAFFSALRDLLIELQGPGPDIDAEAATETDINTEVIEEAVPEITESSESADTSESTDSTEGTDTE